VTAIAVLPGATAAAALAVVPAAAVLLEQAARPLLLLHAVLGFTAVFAATHLAVYALLTLRGRGLSGLRRFSWIAPAAAAPQFALGLLLYPAYRVHVRAADLDRSAPFVAQLFDLKEHLAALGVVLVLAAAAIARAALRNDGGPDLRPAAAALSSSGAALLWAVALLGLYVTARHPVGAP
jgi:hypothetical protein